MARKKAKPSGLRAQALSDEVRNRLKNTTLTAIGNSNRKMKEVAQDLINDSDLPYEYIAANCFLCPATVQRLAEGVTKHPQDETLERVYRFFNLRVDLKAEVYKPRFLNRPKGE